MRKALSWLSLAWMTVEGTVAITSALIAGSVARLGFGIDSAIEGLASVIVIWRFTGDRRLSNHAELRAQKAVAISFFLLAPYIAQDAIRALLGGDHPSTSWVGIGVSVSSIVVMPLRGRAKQRIAERLGSGAAAGEGAQNLLCARPVWSASGMRGPLHPGPVPRTDGLVTVSLTESKARRLQDLPGIIREGIGLSRGWWAMPGAIGVVLYVDVAPKTGSSLSIWATDADLRRFVALPRHVAIMRRYRDRVSVPATTWKTEKFSLSEAWEQRGERLAGTGQG